MPMLLLFSSRYLFFLSIFFRLDIGSFFQDKTLILMIFSRCVAAKGEGASECDKFAKYYRSLCPSEWVRISEIFNILRSMILVFTFNHTGCSKAV